MMLIKFGPEIPLTGTCDIHYSTTYLISHVFQTVLSYRQTIVNEKTICKVLVRIIINLLRRLLTRI